MDATGVSVYHPKMRKNALKFDTQYLNIISLLC